MTLPDTNITSLADSEHAYSTEASDEKVTSTGRPMTPGLTDSAEAGQKVKAEAGGKASNTIPRKA
jgi:hypothetical protein